MRVRVIAEVGGASSTTAWGRKFERWLFQGARWGYAAAGLAFVAVVCLSMWYAREPIPAPVLPPVARAVDVSPPVLEVPKAPELVPARTVPKNMKTRTHENAKPVAAKPVAAKPVEETKQIVVKLLTDDPNIVIYWLLDQNGGKL